MYSTWRKDWNKFARDVFRCKLDREQQEVLSAVQENRRVSVASGNSRGKDYVAAVSCLCFLYLTPKFRNGVLVENTKVAMTGPTDRQIKNIMVPEITKLFISSQGLPGYLTGHDIRTGYKEWFLTGFKASKDNTEAWTGFHAVHTMFVVTEASGMDENIYTAIEGNLQGDSRFLLIFNPNRSTGYAARTFKQKGWKTFRLDSLNAENVVKKEYLIPGQVDYEWVADKVDQWCSPISDNEYSEVEGDFEWEGNKYRPNDLFRIKVRGMFPKESEDVLVPADWIEAAQIRWQQAKEKNERHNNVTGMVGCDVAGMGSDSSVICPRYGDWVSHFDSYQSSGRADHMHIAGKLVSYVKKDNYALIDTIGEGAGVYSRLREQGYDNAISCKFSDSAKDARGKLLKDINNVYEFANMRAYLYWAVRDWLDPKKGSKAMLPPDPEIMEELTEIRYFFRSDGKMQIESRDDIIKKLKRSPDYSVALSNTFYPIRMKGKGMSRNQLANVLH